MLGFHRTYSYRVKDEAFRLTARTRWGNKGFLQRANLPSRGFGFVGRREISLNTQCGGRVAFELKD